MNINAIHQLLRDNPRTAVGYPQQVRDAASEYARRRREDGAHWNELEAEVGVSRTSMRKWMTTPSVGKFHQVVVVAEPPTRHPEALVITSPAGFTLTGCSLEQAARVLRSLS